MHVLVFVAMFSAFSVLSAPVPSKNNEGPLTPSSEDTGVLPSSSTNVKRDLGSAVLINNCGFDISLDRVTESGNDEHKSVPAGESWSEVYQDGGGISIKVNKGDPSNIAQFEYTTKPDTSQVFYDLSLVNGDPFVAFYQALVPDDQSCSTVQCQPGEQPCAGAYNEPDQNGATHACGESSNVVYHLCGGPVS